MENLYESVHLHIINFLRVDDIIKLSQTSKYYYYLCNDKYIWKQFLDNLKLKEPTKRSKKTIKDLIIKEYKKLCIDCQKYYGKPYCDICHLKHKEIAIKNIEKTDKYIVKSTVIKEYKLKLSYIKNIFLKPTICH